MQAQAELAYILILGTVLPMYLLYRGTEKLTSVHTALYRYIQPVIAGILALVRGQAVFDAANIVALAFIFAVTFNIPCVVAVASTYNETHSAKWTVRIAIYYICVALLMSFVVYHVAALFL